MSRSMYMLSALAPLTMSAVPTSARAIVRCVARAGDSQSPPAAVSKTMSVMRGFASATTSRQATEGDLVATATCILRLALTE